MDFWDVTKVMFRRWYIALPLVLLAGVATAYTGTAVKPDWVLTSYIQLIPPTTALDDAQKNGNPRNPWMVLGLEALSQAAHYATVDQTFLKTLKDGGFSVNFSVVVGEPVAGATFEVVGTSRRQAVETTELVLKRYQDTARSLQAQYGVRQQDMIITQRLDQGENLERPGGKVKRAILAVAGFGLLLAAATTIAVDAFLRLRQRRRRDSEPAVPTEPGIAPRPPHNGSRGAVLSKPDRDAIRVGGVEYRSASAAQPDPEPEQPGPSGDTGDRTMAIEPVGMDATIVLPVQAIRAAGDKGGSRR